MAGQEVHPQRPESETYKPKQPPAVTGWNWFRELAGGIGFVAETVTGGAPMEAGGAVGDVPVVVGNSPQGKPEEEMVKPIMRGWSVEAWRDGEPKYRGNRSVPGYSFGTTVSGAWQAVDKEGRVVARLPDVWGSGARMRERLWASSRLAWRWHAR